MPEAAQVDLGKLEKDVLEPVRPAPPVDFSEDAKRFAPRYRPENTLTQLIAEVRKTKEQLERNIVALEAYLEATRRSVG